MSIKHRTLRGKYEQTDEPTLIRGCLRQHPAAQKALYERFSTLMMGVCFRYARNRADAEDMLQEGFVKVFKNLGQYRGEGSLEGWIRRIMVTTAINHLNRNKYLQQHIGLDQAASLVTAGDEGGDLRGSHLMEMLHRLPIGYKTILNLYAIEGYSHKEIALMLGIAESTSRSQYARAKGFLISLTEKQPSLRETDK